MVTRLTLSEKLWVLPHCNKILPLSVTRSKLNLLNPNKWWSCSFFCLRGWVQPYSVHSCPYLCSAGYWSRNFHFYPETSSGRWAHRHQLNPDPVTHVSAYGGGINQSGLHTPPEFERKAGMRTNWANQHSPGSPVSDPALNSGDDKQSIRLKAVLTPLPLKVSGERVMEKSQSNKYYKHKDLKIPMFASLLLPSWYGEFWMERKWKDTSLW